MQNIKIAIVILTCGALMGCDRSLPPDMLQQKRPSATAVDLTAVIQPLAVALKPLRKSGRLYYRGACESGGESISSPFIKPMQSPAGGMGKALAALREMFPVDKQISVTEEPLGLIRISNAGVSGEILQTKIAKLQLDESEQYDPFLATGAILRTKEVESAMRKLGTRLAGTVSAQMITAPTEGGAHLERVVENITVDQALDRLVLTFPGVVVYQECRGPDGTNLFSIYFVWE